MCGLTETNSCYTLGFGVRTMLKFIDMVFIWVITGPIFFKLLYMVQLSVLMADKVRCLILAINFRSWRRLWLMYLIWSRLKFFWAVTFFMTFILQVVILILSSPNSHGWCILWYIHLYALQAWMLNLSKVSNLELRF